MKKNKKLDQLKRWALGIILFPTFLLLFVLDRVTLVLLVHLETKNLKDWLNDGTALIQSILRVTAFIAIYGFIELLKWII